MMTLFATPTSPYARIARVFVHEAGLADRVAVEHVPLRDPTSKLLQYNPVGRVPTLLTEDGLAIGESRLVCVHLDGCHGGPPLIPQDTRAAAAAQALEGLASGFMEGIV